MHDLLLKLLTPGVSFAGVMDLNGFHLAVAAPPDVRTASPDSVAVFSSALCSAAGAMSRLFDPNAKARHLCLALESGGIHIFWLTLRHALVLHVTGGVVSQEIERNVRLVEGDLIATLDVPPERDVFRFGDDIEIADLGGITFD